ncbi:MAG: hypothetical protein JRH10_04370 [Deltaproteobacteria bacterium]|nr:hypothetical protein [Deltaproteobacteria bacterium]MBW2447136.1 hypothetical protein [Deltaproteobacteria bacterium]
MSSLLRTASRTLRRARLAIACAFLLALAGALVAISPGDASAQGADLNRRALDWLRGRWASPIVCDYEGSARSRLRRLVIAPAAKHVRPTANRITFHGVDTDVASRCSDILGVPAPDVRGSLLVTLPGISRTDLANVEFQRAMRQRGGFDFDIMSGRLRLASWAEGAEPRIVDFAGGVARVRMAKRGTDAARILAPFDSPEKRTFEVETADGAEKLSFHMMLYDFR